MEIIQIGDKKLRITEEHKRMILDYNKELDSKEYANNLVFDELRTITLDTDSIDIIELLKLDKVNWYTVNLSLKDLLTICKSVLKLISCESDMDYIKLMKIDDSLEHIVSTYDIIGNNNYSVMEITNLTLDSGISNLKGINNYLKVKYRSDIKMLEVLDYLKVVIDIIYKKLMDKIQFNIA